MQSTAKSSWVKLLSASLILSATSGCVHVSTDPVPLSNYCLIAKPISYDSVADTPETVQQIERHNSQYVCVCEADCPTASK